MRRLTFGLIALSSGQSGLPPTVHSLIDVHCIVLFVASVERASHNWRMIGQFEYTKYGFSAFLLHWVVNVFMAGQLVQAAQ